jgi:hypothetical protein
MSSLPADVAISRKKTNRTMIITSPSILRRDLYKLSSGLPDIEKLDSFIERLVAG